MKNKLLSITLIIFIVIVIVTITYCSTYPFKNAEFDENKVKFKEADYVKAYCKGVVEYRLPDRTRIDCLTEEYAIEFDWAKKWAEGVGQSLYYAKKTGKKPAIAIIVKTPKDDRYIERIKFVDKNITVFKIKAKDYQE